MRRVLIPLVLATAALLSACQETAAPAPAAITDIVAASNAGTGFVVGAKDARQTVYVYFDAQCPHCGELWTASQPLLGEVRMVWIPVGVMSPASVSQGAAILNAADPAQTMTAHEAQLRGNRRGMAASFPSGAQRKVIDANTDLFQRIGGRSIPLIVTRHAKTGEPIRQEGSGDTPALRKLLGLSQ